MEVARRFTEWNAAISSTRATEPCGVPLQAACRQNRAAPRCMVFRACGISRQPHLYLLKLKACLLQALPCCSLGAACPRREPHVRLTERPARRQSRCGLRRAGCYQNIHCEVYDIFISNPTFSI